MKSASLLPLLLAATLLARPSYAEPAKAPEGGAPPPENAFAAAFSDVAPDPSIRFGVLPNGMRYMIAPNNTPTGQTSVRLRIGSGSLQESDAQQGLAHFLEHMAFKGSTHVPRDQMVKLLERHGLAFGPDTNAQTGFTETVFMLDLPKSDPETLDLGLMLMRETASELTLDAGAMDAERGVVLSEERQRDTPDYEAFKARLSALLIGQRAPARLPIGQVEVLKTAPVAEVRAYYEANYRPERTTLIVVGPADPKAVEAAVRARFEDWRAKGAPTTEPDLGAIRPLKAATKLIVQPGAHESVSIAWRRPFEGGYETEAKDRKGLLETLAAAIVTRRLDRLAKGADAPFVGAGVTVEDEERSARVTNATALPKPGAWKAALASLISTVREAAAFGVTPAEIAQETAELRARYETAAAGASTRRTPDIAGELVQAVDGREVPTSPAQDLVRFEQALKGATPETLDPVLASLFSDPTPLIVLIEPTAPEGGASALEAAVAAAKSKPLVPPTRAAAVRWPYEDFGPRGVVAARRTVADLGVTFVTFKNGVQLNIKPAAFQKDQALVTVRLGSGRLALPRDQKTPLWAAPAWVFGGLKKIAPSEMETALAARLYSAQASLADDALTLSGGTRRGDLHVQLQVLAAYVSDPAFRPEGFERVKSAFASQIDQLGATPEGVFGRDGARLQHGGDLRWATPTQADVRATDLNGLRRVLEPILAAAPLEVDVVGDVDVEDVVAAAASTFGALGPRPPTAGPAGKDQVLTRPALGADVVRLTHAGRKDQAIATRTWFTDGLFAAPQKARATNVAAAVFQLRLTDQIRVREGAAYSPAVVSVPSDVFDHWGLATAEVEIPPEKISTFYSDVERLAADLRETGPSADEFERAVKPRIETLFRAQQTDEYWLTWIAGADKDPRRLDVVRQTLDGYRALTPADVKAAAAAFTPQNSFDLVVAPTP